MQRNLLKFFNASELKTYIKKSHLEDNLFMPYSTLPFLMHWSDHFKTTDALRSVLSQDEESFEIYQKIITELECLKKLPLWIEVDGQVYSYRVYDIYHHLFVTKKFSHEKFYGISFIGPYGPFVQKRLFECLNFHTYKNFIYNFLIEGKIPQRTFRLQCEQQILMSYGKSSKKDFNHAMIRSLSEDGMLVELEGSAAIDQQNDRVAFHLSTNELNHSFNDAKKMITHSKFLYSKDPNSYFEFFAKDLVFRTSLGHKNKLSHFIFVKYENALEENLWPDLLSLARFAKEQVEETLDLAA